MKAHVVLILLFVLVTNFSALQESLTFDEVVYLQEGRRNLIGRQFTEPYGPPLIKESAALPLVLGFNRYIPSSYPNLQALTPRLMIVGLSVILLLSVYRFVTCEFNSLVGLTSLFFLVFNPDVLAHSHYVTLDMGATLFFWLSFVTAVGVWRKPSLTNYLMLGLFMGLAAASKLTVWPLLFGLLIVALLNYFIVRDQRIWRVINVKVLFTLALVILIVWGSYGFGKQLVIERRDESSRVSVKAKEWARVNGLPWVANVVGYLETRPVPLGGYLAIIKNSVIRSQQVRLKEPHNFFINWLMKSTLPYIFVFFYGIGVIWERRKGKLLSVFVTASFLFVSLSGLPPLVRHLLPLLPFMSVIAGYGLAILIKSGHRVWALGLVLWQAASVMSYTPHYLTYTNEIVFPEVKINRLNDSNLDWGQGLLTFKKYLIDKKEDRVNFSYFGRDDGGAYGLLSVERWGGYKTEEICRFHKIDINFMDFIRPSLAVRPDGARLGLRENTVLIAISVTNWVMCGYRDDPEFSFSKVKEIVGGSILIY